MSLSPLHTALFQRLDFTEPFLPFCDVMEMNVYVSSSRVVRWPIIIVPQVNGQLLYFAIGSKVLGKSIYGAVYAGMIVEPTELPGVVRNSERPVAIKVYDVSEVITSITQGTKIEHPIKEIAAMQCIGNNHRNLMGVIACGLTSMKLYVIMRLASNTDLFNVVTSPQQPSFTETKARGIFRQLVPALKILHQQHGIAHRDLSLENILVDSTTGTCTIIDYGLCCRLPYPHTIPMPLLGKRFYMAPELFPGGNLAIDPSKCDVWSLGIILFMMLTRRPLVNLAVAEDSEFKKLNERGLTALLVADEAQRFSPLLLDMLIVMLQPHPQHRIDIQGILQHGWMNVYP